MDQPIRPVLHRGKKERSLPRSLGTAVLATAVFLPCLAFVLTFFAYKSSDPARLIPTFAYIAALTSALFCGFLCARLRGKQGLLCGLASGLLMVVLFLLALLIFSGESELQGVRVLFTNIPVFLLTVFGGMIGGTKRTPKRRHMRR